MSQKMCLMVAGTAVLLTAQIVKYPVYDWEYEHECTSWIIFSDMTKNNTNILHKNRDATSKDIFVHCSPAGAHRKWLAMGDYGSRTVNSGINSSGLAVGLNSGEKCTDNSTNSQGKTTPAIVKVVLEECDTAAQAVSKVKELMAAGDYYHGDKGSIFLFMDVNEGYILEMTAHFCSVQKYEHGYAYRANIWHNPDMAQYTDNTSSAFLNSCNREFMVRTQMNAAMRTRGRIAISDVLALSRSNRMDNTPIDRLVCYKTTNSASSFEIDREFPAVLSTGYMQIGHPRHTICVPVPLCVDTLDLRVNSTAFAQAAFARFKEFGPDAEIPAAWLEYEKTALATYAAVREKARDALRQGRAPEAVAMLNKASGEYIDGAAKLLGI